jgi:DNA-binding Lrp family transcriptional regulator
MVMPVRAYVFIDTTPGRAGQVADGVAKLPGVKMAHPVTGSYDVIVFLEAKDLAALGELVSARVHRLPGVLKTTTNIVAE